MMLLSIISVTLGVHDPALDMLDLIITRAASRKEGP